MTLPNFLIIGVAKAGTTALYEAVKLHPQIYMSPVKEPGFFTFVDSPLVLRGPRSDVYRSRIIADQATYEQLFAGVTDQLAIGEASQQYLSCWHPERTAANIKRLIPTAKLIAILRQPADRAYSSFAHRVQIGFEPERNFRKMLRAAERPERRQWLSYRCQNDGFYYANLKPYFAAFPREQIRVYLYEDWNTQPHQVLTDIFQFLGVTAQITPAMTQRQNETTWVRQPALATFLAQPHPVKRQLARLLRPRLYQHLMSGLAAWNQGKPPTLDRRLRRELTDRYRDDILQLQELIGRDLSHWLV